MPNQTPVAKRGTCPSCEENAKRISTVTLRALLIDEFAQEFLIDGDSCCDSNGEGCTPIKGDTGWRFCESTDCDVVYFSEEGDTRFVKSQLKVPVGVKETTGERPLCYCFGHSVASITEELRTKGCTNALEDIRAKMKDPGCRCEVENPSGSCCLGSVAKGIQVAQAELGVAPSRAIKLSSGRGERIAKIGTLVSAIMASACCWLPLVLLAAGVSGAGIASTLEAYRPLFMVVTFSFLAAAFYYTYRPRKSADGVGQGCCDAEETKNCCDSATKGRFNMMSLNKVMLWAVTAMAVVFLLFPSYVGVLLGTSGSRTVTENMDTTLLEIEGMTCEGCTSIAEKAILEVPGVLAADVDFEKKLATVGTDKGSLISADQIMQALRRVGYGARLLGSQAEKELHTL